MQRTSEDLIAQEIEQLREGATFAEVQDSVANTYVRLHELGIFEAISIEIDALGQVHTNEMHSLALLTSHRHASFRISTSCSASLWHVHFQMTQADHSLTELPDK